MFGLFAGGIEDFISSTHDNTEQAGEEIEKSYDIQKKAYKRSRSIVCLLFAVLVVFVLLVTKKVSHLWQAADKEH